MWVNERPVIHRTILPSLRSAPSRNKLTRRGRDEFSSSIRDKPSGFHHQSPSVQRRGSPSPARPSSCHYHLPWIETAHLDRCSRRLLPRLFEVQTPCHLRRTDWRRI